MDGSDWTPIISKLKSAAPDALITSTAGGAPNVTLTKQLRAAGVKLPMAIWPWMRNAKSMARKRRHLSVASYVTGIEAAANKTSWPRWRRSSQRVEDAERPVGARYERFTPTRRRRKAGSTDSAAVLKRSAR